MTEVGIVDSLKYGSKLYLYLIGVVLVGGGGMILGGALAVPEIQAWLANSGIEAIPLAGGVIIWIIGVSVWFSGFFGIFHKLIGDSVAEGIAIEDELEGGDTVETAADSTPAPTTPSETSDATPAAGIAQDRAQSNGSTSQQQSPSSRHQTETDTTEPAQARTQQAGQATEPPVQEQSRQSSADSKNRAPEKLASNQSSSGGDTTQSESGQPPVSEAESDGTADSDERERTAEEIAFGAPEDDDGESAHRGTGERTEAMDEDIDEVPTYEEMGETPDGGSTNKTSDSSNDPLAD